MKIKIERSGGFAGIPLSKEVDTKDLPSELISTAKKILSNRHNIRLQSKLVPKRDTDRFTYRISIYDGQDHKVVEYAESDIIGDLKSLVQFVERKSIKEK